jgi:DNA polymerase III subunit epsilon
MYTPFTVIDFEGTHRDTKSRATEIGVVNTNFEFTIHDYYETVLKPPVAASLSSLGHSRLSYDQLESAPTFAQAWPSIHEFISGKVLIAHNYVYDKGVLDRELKDIGLDGSSIPFLCTLEWSRKILKHKLSSFSLQAVCAYFDISTLNAHEAINDAFATLKLMSYLVDLSPELKSTLTDLRDQAVIFPQPSPEHTSIQIRNRELVVKLDEESLETIAAEILSNPKVKMTVVTGKFETDKPTFVSRLERLQLPLTESPVTAGTAFLIKGVSGGNSKIKGARKYGRPALLEVDALKLLGILEAKKGIT